MIPAPLDQLPISAYRSEIITALREHQVIVVDGDTGCGKSTVLPFLCREAYPGSGGRIGITEPRRIAAVSLAGYTSRLEHEPVGLNIGFNVRYSRRLRKKTRIVYMTDGVLLVSLSADITARMN